MSAAKSTIRRIWSGLGPGLITGAADDDPSGSPRFQAIALDNLVAAGKIRKCDRERVRLMRRVLAYPPEREGEVDKYAHVRPLLRQWQERQAGVKPAQGD
jgi:hypothetical protein